MGQLSFADSGAACCWFDDRAQTVLKTITPRTYFIREGNPSPPQEWSKGGGLVFCIWIIIVENNSFHYF